MKKAIGKKSSTLINPGRPNSAPTDSDSGKENFNDSETNRPESAASSQATIVGGVLNRPKPNEIDQDIAKTFGKKGITTIFQPIEKQLNDKGNIAKTWKVDNSVRPITKPNIHTISSNSTKSRDVQEFSGTGHTLGSNEGDNKVDRKDSHSSDIIVRRIPGIGLITSERPVAAHTITEPSASKHVTDTADVNRERPYSASLFTSDSDTDFGNSDTAARSTADAQNRLESSNSLNNGLVVIQSSSSQESLSPSLLDEIPERSASELSPSDGHSTNVGRSGLYSTVDAKASTSSDSEIVKAKKPSDGVNANGKRVYMPYFSSDDDDSDILFKLGAGSDSPPAKRRNVDDQQRTSYPSVCSKKSIKYKKKRIFGKSTGAMRKTASSGQNNRAADRNQRGLSLGDKSDDETTDDEERRSLGSAIRRTGEIGSRSENTSPDSDVLVVPSRSNSRSSDTVSSIASIRILTDSEKSVTVLSSPDEQENDVKEIVKIESPSLTVSPSEVLGIDFDKSQFSAHKRNSKYTPSVKRPIPITPPRPSTSYSGTPAIKRTPSSELGSLRKKFKFNLPETSAANVGGTNTGRMPAEATISNSQSSTSSAFHPYNRSDSQEDLDPLVECPSCPGKFRTSQINDHLDTCLDMLPDL